MHQGPNAEPYCNLKQTHLGIARLLIDYFTKVFIKNPSEYCMMSAAKAHTSAPWLATLPVTDCQIIAATRARGHGTQFDKFSR